ncbi:adenylyltransferase and sulfurtransferase MOCS3-like [Lathyrus oleraceus]|uniref:adenylyltransferase and sulfurtransferase MOCS3-like n=1 Tax=Pisum sativum TaxID=3888 RepID=UPI0021CFFA29|nr:adenylyltransferase and sulfurtransferase MOCS3-like [Pisum sativum]
MELNRDEPFRKSKHLALKFVSKPAKAPQVRDSEEASHVEGSEDDSDEYEMKTNTLPKKKLQYIKQGGIKSIHTEAYTGQPKVESIAAACRSINSSLEVVEHEEALQNSDAPEIFSKYDIIMDATDNAPTRYLISDGCVILGKPLVSDAATGLEGQLTIYNHNGGLCFRCSFQLHHLEQHAKAAPTCYISQDLSRIRKKSLE